jgi:hypothetical protein
MLEKKTNILLERFPYQWPNSSDRKECVVPGEREQEGKGKEF